MSILEFENSKRKKKKNNPEDELTDFISQIPEDCEDAEACIRKAKAYKKLFGLDYLSDEKAEEIIKELSKTATCLLHSENDNAKVCGLFLALGLKRSEDGREAVNGIIP